MAVELAKVSLWLDAFTLGAPLNFLDHHLRCGNSLVGATFAELEEATKNELFKLDYEPLLRAINHVLFISKMADATAAEVIRSRSEYDQARSDLQGFQVILDVLVAQHFGLPEAVTAVLRTPSGLAFRSRDDLLQSLGGAKERQLVAQVETLARRPDRRFFHWEIEFPEVFFGFVDADERQIKHKDKIKKGSAGFDCVVGNPPYDVLAEKELETELDELLGYFGEEGIFEPAAGGKQNLYKLFICRGLHVLRQSGRLGRIVPMPLLGDEQAVGVRKLLLSKSCLAAVEAFPQKDDYRNRVFEDAKLSTCIFVTAKKNEDAPFRARVHPGKVIEPGSPSLIVRRSQVELYDPENQPIVACSQEDWDLAVKIMGSGRMRRLGEFCASYQGEVNETTDRGKGHISYAEKDGPRILRGANVTLYALRPSSQGEDIFMLRNKFLKGKKPTAKAWHHQQNRIGFQRKSPQNNFRRLIACHVPIGEFCCESISYFPEQESAFPLNMLLALLNSKLLEWFFRLGSTNAMVSEYQINKLPAPSFEKDGKPEEILSFIQAVAKGKWDDAFGVVEPLIAEAPFPTSIMACMMRLVDEITRIEATRGDIARTERSALAPEAQPYQDLIDRILYRMAGLTEADAQGLQKRLEGML